MSIKQGPIFSRRARDSGLDKRTGTATLFLFVIIMAGCSQPHQREMNQPMNWNNKLEQELPRLGHRNWILIVDAAYPAQSRHGIETIVTGTSHLEVVRAVLEAVDAADHVRAKVYIDKELKYINEESAPGITVYRRELSEIMVNRSPMEVPHEELITKIDEAAKMFDILVLKTVLVLPYTSVFLELDCGYWNAEAEAGLRSAIQQAE